jgi:hypothetical protein
MRLRLFLSLTVLAIIAVAQACADAGDLNSLCELVTKDAGDPTGRTPAPLLLSEIPTTQTDFISFGSPDCDELICVRDYQYVQDGGAPYAYGYCSAPCTPGAANQCQSYDSSLDANPQTKLNCRPLLLDSQTLAAICSDDAGACQEYFSNTRSPYFCARGQTPDGGP